MSTHLESGSVTRAVSDHAADLTPERGMDRHHWSQHISRLDPATDYHEIYRILVTYEFPWDMNQSLSSALPHLRDPEHRQPAASDWRVH